MSLGAFLGTVSAALEAELNTQLVVAGKFITTYERQQVAVVPGCGFVLPVCIYTTQYKANNYFYGILYSIRTHSIYAE